MGFGETQIDCCRRQICNTAPHTSYVDEFLNGPLDDGWFVSEFTVPRLWEIVDNRLESVPRTSGIGPLFRNVHFDASLFDTFTVTFEVFDKYQGFGRKIVFDVDPGGVGNPNRTRVVASIFDDGTGTYSVRFPNGVFVRTGTKPLTGDVVKIKYTVTEVNATDFSGTFDGDIEVTVSGVVIATSSHTFPVCNPQTISIGAARGTKFIPIGRFTWAATNS